MSQRIFFNTLLFILVCGCSSSPDYPSNWSQLLPSDSNIEIMLNGTYDCSGTVVSGYSDSIEGHLPVFISLKDIDKGQCDSIVFKFQKTGSLMVYAYKENKLLTEKKFIAGVDYTIKDGWITFEQKAEVISKDGVLGYATGDNSFTLNRSGNLVVKSSGSGAGIMLLIPVMNSSHNWVLFKRLSNKSLNQIGANNAPPG